MAHMRQVFAGDVQSAGALGAASGEDELVHFVAGLPRRGTGRDLKSVAGSLNSGHWLKSSHSQVELLDDAAEIIQIFLAAGLGLIDRLQRHAGDGDAFVGTEKSRLRREPGDRVADLTGFEMQHAQASALEGDVQLQPDRAGSDDSDIS